MRPLSLIFILGYLIFLATCTTNPLSEPSPTPTIGRAAGPMVRPPTCFPNCAGADLRGINLSHLDLTEGDFAGADLTGSNLNSTILNQADLEGAILRDSSMYWARIWGGNLKGADLSGVLWDYIDIQGSEYDAKTIWPENFRGNEARGIFVPEDSN